MNCFQLLGLPDQPIPSPAQVKRAWQLAASKHHPDKGGDAAEFNRLRLAYEEALAEAERPKLCIPCLGTGKVGHVSGWHIVKMTCLHCGGSGTES